MSFFEELKRRNVFKVGIAYAVGAWLLLQLTEVLSELLTLPSTIGPIVVSAVAVGFPIVIFIAWAFEMTPEGIKKEAEVDRSQSIAPQTGKKLNIAIFAMMALAIVYLLYDKFSAPEMELVTTNSAAVSTPAGEPAASEAEEAIDSRSIAVLPFDNRSRNEDDEFFVEGVHDDLLTNLARIGSLKVISRTSVSKYKDTEKTIPEIASELGVATVMEGAVQRSGNTVRINVQLIDAQTDEHLWAEIFDREMTANNLFAIQTEISEKIAEALKTTLSPEEQNRISDRPTENLAAYNAFLRGRLLVERRNSTDLDQAFVEFERAVELDPNFALAWVGMADTAQLRTTYSNLGNLEALEIREEAVSRALEINDQLGEAHLSQAMLHLAYERWDEGELSFQKSLELSPNYARAYQWYADFVTRWPARTREALRLTEQAVELDPLSSILRYEIAEKLIFLGRYVDAEARVRDLMASDPEFPVSMTAMQSIMQATGRIDQQVYWLKRKIELDPGDIQEYQNLVFAMLDLENAEAIPALRRAMEEIDDEHLSLGFVDIFTQVHERNYQGAIESGNWVNSQIGAVPSFQNFFGFMHALNGDDQKAREAFEKAEPKFYKVDTFRAAIERQPTQGCIDAFFMMRTGDEELGKALLSETIKYLEEELPLYMDHADRFGYPGCHMINGDPEKAMASLETQVAHGHLSGWWIASSFPWFEPLRGDPRYESTLQTIREKMATQRANLAQMDTEAGP